jgi:hypothetical protein
MEKISKSVEANVIERSESRLTPEKIAEAKKLLKLIYQFDGQMITNSVDYVKLENDAKRLTDILTGVTPEECVQNGLPVINPYQFTEAANDDTFAKAA